MDSQIIATLIRDSVASGSSTPTLRTPREAYIRDEETRLLGCLIEPTEVSVVEETFEYGVLDEMKKEVSLTMARSRWYSLVYPPATKHFSLTFYT